MDVWGRNSPDTWMSRVETLGCSVPARFGELGKAAVTGDKIKRGRVLGIKRKQQGYHIMNGLTDHGKELESYSKCTGNPLEDLRQSHCRMLMHFLHLTRSSWFFE